MHGIAAEEGVHVRNIGSGTDDRVDVFSYEGLVEELGLCSRNADTRKEDED